MEATLWCFQDLSSLLIDTPPLPANGNFPTMAHNESAAHIKANQESFQNRNEVSLEHMDR